MGVQLTVMLISYGARFARCGGVALHNQGLGSRGSDSVLV